MAGEPVLASLAAARRPIVRGLGLAIVAICALHLVAVVSAPAWRGDAGSIRFVVGEWLHLGSERGLGTWFAVLQLAFAAVIAGAIAHGQRRQNRPWRAWAVVAIIFSYLSLDEQIAIHENFGGVVTRLGADEGVVTLWIFPALGLVAIVGVSLFSFVWHLPGRTRWGLIGAGSLFVAGAIGFEAAAWASVMLLAGDIDAIYSVPVGLLQFGEEGLELLAVTVAIATLLDHAASANEFSVEH